MRAGLAGRRRLALEQCKSAPLGPRRPPGPSRSPAGDDRRLARTVGPRDPEENLQIFREHVRTGRPWAKLAFVDRLERIVGESFAPKNRGVHQNYSNNHKRFMSPDIGIVPSAALHPRPLSLGEGEEFGGHFRQERADDDMIDVPARARVAHKGRLEYHLFFQQAQVFSGCNVSEWETFIKDLHGI